MFYGPNNKKSSRKETKWVKLPVSCNTWLKSSCLCTLSNIVIDSLAYSNYIYNFQGIPQQKDHNTCGYYIMCFMKEIVEDKDLEYATKVRLINCFSIIYGDIAR